MHCFFFVNVYRFSELPVLARTLSLFIFRFQQSKHILKAAKCVTQLILPHTVIQTYIKSWIPEVQTILQPFHLVQSIKSSVIYCWLHTYKLWPGSNISSSSCWHICDFMNTKAWAKHSEGWGRILSAYATKRKEVLSNACSVSSQEKTKSGLGA